MSQQIQFKRGLNNNKTGIILEQGEPVWTTDMKQLSIGDGSTYGGIPVGGEIITGSIFHTTSNLGSGVFYSYSPATTELVNLNVKVATSASDVSSSCFIHKSATFHRADDLSLNQIGSTTTIASHVNGNDYGMNMIISGDKVRVVVNSAINGGSSKIWIAKIQKTYVGESFSNPYHID